MPTVAIAAQLDSPHLKGRPPEHQREIRQNVAAWSSTHDNCRVNPNRSLILILNSCPESHALSSWQNFPPASLPCVALSCFIFCFLLPQRVPDAAWPLPLPLLPYRPLQWHKLLIIVHSARFFLLLFFWWWGPYFWTCVHEHKQSFWPLKGKCYRCTMYLWEITLLYYFNFYSLVIIKENLKTDTPSETDMPTR